MEKNPARGHKVEKHHPEGKKVLTLIDFNHITVVQNSYSIYFCTPRLTVFLDYGFDVPAWRLMKVYNITVAFSPML